MAHTQTHFHGSDLEKIEAAYGIKKEDIINFSSNVNPLGLSSLIKCHLPQKIELIASYPDREYTSLRNAIGNYVHAQPDHILVGNGSTELISLGIKSIAPKKALIIGPTYSEYEREITLLGGTTTYFPLLEENNFVLDSQALIETLSDDLDLLVICNPNNPTSTAILNTTLLPILNACEEKHIFVLIDETYVEFAPEVSLVTATHLAERFSNLMVIRGVSKFFAAPGLRLGYAICSNQKHLDLINHLKNPWTINALAAYAGELMLSDKEYIQNTRSYIESERKKIVDTLSTWNFVKFYPPTANFILVQILDPKINAPQLFEKLLLQNLMIRDASSFTYLGDRFFRFCFLTTEENDLLLQSISTIFHNL